MPLDKACAQNGKKNCILFQSTIRGNEFYSDLYMQPHKSEREPIFFALLLFLVSIQPVFPGMGYHFSSSRIVAKIQKKLTLGGMRPLKKSVMSTLINSCKWNPAIVVRSCQKITE